MGSEAMILAGFGITPENRSFHAIRDRFFELYSSCSMEDSQLFPGIEQLLNALDARRLPWGIVTNKVARLTFPLLKQLDLLTRAACVVCGDTTAFQKPHPAPLLHACEQLPCEPGKAWYVGDARRDVDAGHAAGMFTVAALYGYWGNEEPPQAWGADALIEKPVDLLELLP